MPASSTRLLQPGRGWRRAVSTIKMRCSRSAVGGAASTSARRRPAPEPDREPEGAADARACCPRRSRRPSARRAAGRSPAPGRSRRGAGWTSRPPGRTPGTAGELLGGDADAGVGDLDPQQSYSAVLGSSWRSRRTWTSPRSVNLIALPTRFTSTWRSRDGSPWARAGHVVVDQGGQVEAARPRLLGQQVHDLVDDGARAEVGQIERHPPGLDLREVEQVVDQRQERLGAGLDRLGGVALLGGEVGVQQQARPCR